MNWVPLVVSVPLTESSVAANVTWSPLEKVIAPASLNVVSEFAKMITLGPTAIVAPAATVKAEPNT